ncbi:serine/threonine-protein phosphatase 6 regulatory ankyrin repeat subunit B-like isoform X2 [Macrosteles quadrilineatus]|nr:serine/threonine-protein phosphatase 6 regulatory ankyrin repeat subunit B-like isoform X2 [Macrosteles quadrilineatus]
MSLSHHVLDMSPPPQGPSPQAPRGSTSPRVGGLETEPRDDRRRGRLNAELLIEVLAGNTDSVKRCLETGSSVNATCRPTLTSALHLAVACRHEDIARLLLSWGADVLRRDLEGRQAIHVAAAVGDPVLLRLLLQRDSDMVNSQVVPSREAEDTLSLDCWSHDHSSVSDKIPQVAQKSSPLHQAAQRVNLTCVILLLEQGAKVDVKDGRDLTPLDVVGEITIGKAVGLSKSSKTPSDMQNIINCLLQKGAKFTIRKSTLGQGVENQVTMEVNCLHTAVLQEDPQLIEFLLDNEASLSILNGEGLTPLHLAVSKRLLEPLRIILEKNQSIQVLDAVDFQGRTPLHLAVAQMWLPGVSLLLEAGADVKVTSSEGQTVLHMAVATHQPDLLKELLTIREAVNMIDARNRHHETPLSWAVSMGQLACVEVLLAKGADVTIKLPGKCSLIHLCAIRGHSSVLAEILKYPRMAMFKNSQTNEQNGGLTALHLAALEGSTSCADVLLAAGCDVHKVSFQCPYRKSTPLHVAAMKGRSKIVLAIVNHDLSTLKAKNEDKWYPLHVAARFSNHECVKIMLLNGANLATTVLDSDFKKRTAFDIIVCNILDPAAFVNDVFDCYIQVNEYPLNSNECEIKVNYDILQPLGPDRKQMKVLDSLLNCKKCAVQENVLLHPLIQTFLHLKWRRMRVLFFVIMALYMMFTLSLTSTAMCYYVLWGQIHSRFLYLVTCGCSFTLGISLLIITIQELLQAFRMQRYYFKDLESWIKWSSFILSFLVLLGDHPTEWLAQVASVAVLLSWLELLFLLSRWPSTLGFYIVMFFTVARNVFTVLATFLFVILGFMFAFMIHFRDSGQFTDVWRSFTKVLVMTFELDYEKMFRTVNGMNAVVGRGIFLYFMVLMAIVLMNLLVGIAVSDIAMLEKQGRARRLAKQIDFLSMLESYVYNRYLFAFCPNKLSKIIRRFRAVDRVLKFYPGRPRKRGNQLTEDLIQSLIDNVVRQRSNCKKKNCEVGCIGDDVSVLRTL